MGNTLTIGPLAWILLIAYGANLLALIVVAVRTYKRIASRDLFVFLCISDLIAALPMSALFMRWFPARFPSGGMAADLYQWFTQLADSTWMVAPLFCVAVIVPIYILAGLAVERIERHVSGDDTEWHGRGLLLFCLLSCVHLILIALAIYGVHMP
jgi:hypothetical protein